MELTETRSKIQDILFDTNRGLPYVHSRQIHGFLDRVETKFNILINDPHWDIAKMFVSKYPDLYIEKEVFLKFLDDLLQLDFVVYVHDKSDTRSFEVPSALGSPLAISGNSDNLFKDYEFERLSKHIDDNIEKLSRRSFEEKVPRSLQPAAQTTLPKATSSSIPESSSTKASSKQDGKTIKEIKIGQLIVSGMNTFTSCLPLVNMFLLLTLIFLLLCQYVSLGKHIYPGIRSFFLYETQDDIYWWQRWPFTERLIWTLLEYIQGNEEQQLVK